MKQLPGCGTPAQKKLVCPVFQPREQGEVVWNTTLLSKPALYYNLFGYKGSDIIGNYIGMATLRLPLLLYASCKTTRGSEPTTGSRTMNDDDGLQSAGTLARTFILAHAHRNHTKQASNPGTTCKLAWYARSVHWMYLQAHNNQKHSRQTIAWQLQVKQELTWDHQDKMAWTTWTWYS